MLQECQRVGRTEHASPCPSQKAEGGKVGLLEVEPKSESAMFASTPKIKRNNYDHVLLGNNSQGFLKIKARGPCSLTA